MGKDKKPFDWKVIGALVTLQTTIITGIFEIYNNRQVKDEKHIREHAKLEAQSTTIEDIKTDISSIKTNLSKLIWRNRTRINEADNNPTRPGTTR